MPVYTCNKSNFLIMNTILREMALMQTFLIVDTGLYIVACTFSGAFHDLISHETIMTLSPHSSL